MKQHSLPIASIIAITLIFGASALVSAQTFTEPTPTTTLPAPITSTNKGQGIMGALTIGATLQQSLGTLDQAKLFVNGTTLTRMNSAASIAADVTVAGNAFKIRSSQVLIGSAANSCAQNAQVCIVESSALQPAVKITADAGDGVFGETTASGFAGITAEGHYGIQATAVTNQTIAAYGVSCKEVVGSPGLCETYGDAGYFSGDVKIENVGGNPSGYISGNGSGLYKVKSLHNKNNEAPSEGIMYRYITQTIPAASASVSITGLPANVVSVVGVESADGNTFVPIGKSVTYSYDAALNRISLSHASGTTHTCKLMLMYIAP